MRTEKRTGIEKHWADLAAEGLERERCEAARVLRAHLLYDWHLTESDKLWLSEMDIIG